MFKESLVDLTFQGGVLRVSSNSAAKKVLPKKTPKKSCRVRGKKTYADRNEGSISRALQRSKVNFAQTVGTIKNKPTYHISLIMPKRLSPDTEHLVLKSYLNKFFKRLGALYPKAYFIYMFDWSAKTSLHAHVLTRFGIKSSHRKKERHARKIWNEIVDSGKPQLLEMTKFHEINTISYLTSNVKDNNSLVVLQRLNGGHRWAVVQANNIRKYKKYTLSMTSLKHEVFKDIMRELIVQAGLPASNLEQMKKNDYCLNYLLPSLLQQARKEFLELRKRHGS